MVNVVKLDRMLLKGVNTEDDTFFPKTMDDSAIYIDDFLSHDSIKKVLAVPFKMLAAMAAPNFTKAFQKAAYDQTFVNEAQIACALERYRLQNGKYPDTLAVLVPQFISKIPHGLIGGKPMNYYCKGGENFRLYSIGWNESDDGGIPARTADGKEDREKGDWVWQCPSN
jgi:type II secretory pathway pseudopilin PulG